jgi:parallel beta-helix repeat protein
MTRKARLQNAAIRLLSGLALVLLVAAQPAATPRAAAQEGRATLAEVILVVDRSDDITGSPACTDAPDDCSLRDAIQIANADPANSYTIYFADDYTILLNGPLSITADGLYIVGRAPDGGAPRRIEIDAGAHGQAFIIQGSGGILADLRIYGASAGASNIWITGTAYGVAIAHNVIGDSDPADGCQTGSVVAYGGIYINATGGGCAGCMARAWIYDNTIECHGGDPGNGIDVVDTDDVVIGAHPQLPPDTSYRNNIRSNAGDGIHITGSNATHHHIASNFIGANTAGLSAGTPPNAEVGIYMGDLASNTVITGNLISGNGWAGVWLNDTRAVTITHNYIGTDISGTAAIPNGHDGVAITDGAQDNRVGGGSTATRNLISGNTSCGVHIRDGATANYVNGNYIGLNAAGNGAIPNGLAGVCIFDADNNAIGSAEWYGVYQHVSGNTREGIYVENASGTFIGHSNYIGVASDRVTPLGNGLEGVMLVNTTNTNVYASIVAYNGGAGIALTGPATAVGNRLMPFSRVYGNGGLPIDLGNDGHTPNDPGDADSGPNTLLNYPVITAFSGNVVTGTACANCTVRLYWASGDPARPGGGGTYFQSAQANASGIWAATLASGLTPASLSMQACSLSSNTSELSPRPVVYVPLVARD